MRPARVERVWWDSPAARLALAAERSWSPESEVCDSVEEEPIEDRLSFAPASVVRLMTEPWLRAAAQIGPGQWVAIPSSAATRRTVEMFMASLPAVVPPRRLAVGPSFVVVWRPVAGGTMEEKNRLVSDFLLRTRDMAGT